MNIIEKFINKFLNDDSYFVKVIVNQENYGETPELKIELYKDKELYKTINYKTKNVDIIDFRRNLYYNDITNKHKKVIEERYVKLVHDLAYTFNPIIAELNAEVNVEQMTGNLKGVKFDDILELEHSIVKYEDYAQDIVKTLKEAIDRGQEKLPRYFNNHIIISFKKK